MENFLKESIKISEFDPQKSQSSFKISSMLSEIKLDFPEVFDAKSGHDSDKNLQLLNKLIAHNRKLNPSKDWTSDLPFYIQKIKNNESVF